MELCKDVLDARRVSAVMALARDMVPDALAMRRLFGVLRQAEDVTAGGLAAAHANDCFRRNGWCSCPKSEIREQEWPEAYYRDLDTGDHGWMCCKCRGITQTG